MKQKRPCYPPLTESETATVERLAALMMEVNPRARRDMEMYAEGYQAGCRERELNDDETDGGQPTC